MAQASSRAAALRVLRKPALQGGLPGELLSEIAAAAERLKMLLNSRGWQRHNDLLLVVDSFTRECIEPEEDKADADDPKAQKARLIQRQRYSQQVRDADRDLSEAVDRALDLLSREPDDERALPVLVAAGGVSPRRSSSSTERGGPLKAS